MKNYFFLLIFLAIAPLCQANNIPNGFGIDFDTAMKRTHNYTSDHPNKSRFWRLVKESYNRFIVNDLDYAAQPRIPKIIHQIWVGPRPFPETSKALRDTWLKNHPDWKYKLWREKDIEELGLINKHAYDATPNYGEKSDIARYEILYRLGGLYIDTDFECLRPFDIFHHCCNFYAGAGFGNCEEVYIGLIGSTPNNPVLKKAIDNIKKGSTSTILHRTGPYYFGKCVEQALARGNDRYVIFPVTYFYPWPHYHRTENTRKQIEKWIKPESFAIHHWHVSWSK